MSLDVWFYGPCAVAMVLQLTCENRGPNHITLLALFDSTEADLIFRSREQAGQGVVGHIAVNHHAVHTACGEMSDGGLNVAVNSREHC